MRKLKKKRAAHGDTPGGQAHGKENAAHASSSVRAIQGVEDAVIVVVSEEEGVGEVVGLAQ